MLGQPTAHKVTKISPTITIGNIKVMNINALLNNVILYNGPFCIMEYIFMAIPFGLYLKYNFENRTFMFSRL